MLVTSGYFSKKLFKSLNEDLHARMFKHFFLPCKYIILKNILKYREYYIT